MIEPTIGRKVWFRPNGATHLNGGAFSNFNEDQPMDASVAYVHGERMVNLQVIDHAGVPHAVMSVHFRQPEDHEPVGMYCEWMPYQVGQALVKREAT